jgi:translation elongation factor EF-4
LILKLKTKIFIPYVFLQLPNNPTRKGSIELTGSQLKSGLVPLAQLLESIPNYIPHPKRSVSHLNYLALHPSQFDQIGVVLEIREREGEIKCKFHRKRKMALFVQRGRVQRVCFLEERTKERGEEERENKK